MSKISRSYLETGITQFLSVPLTAAISIIVARVLGADGRGQYALLTTTVVICGIILELGTGYATNYYVGKSVAQEDKGRIIGTAFLTQLILACLAILPLALLTLLLRPTLYKGIQAPVLLFIALTLPVTIVQTMLLNSLQAIFDMRGFNLARILGPGSLCGVLALWLLMGQELSLVFVIVAWIASTALSLGVAWLRLSRLIRIRPNLDRKITGDLYRFGIKAYLGNLSKVLSYRLDVFFVGWLLGPTEVGLYAAAVSVAELVFFIPTVVTSVFLPQVAAHGLDSGLKLTEQVSRVTFLLTLAAGAVIAVAGAIIIQILFGSEFLGSVSALRWLVPGVIILSVWKVLVTGLTGQGFPELISVSALASLAVMVIFDLLLIPLMNVNGASLASSLSYAAAFVVTCIWLARRFGLKTLLNLVPQKADLDFLLAASQRFLAFKEA